MHADEAKDPALIAEVEKLMDQTVSIRLGEEHGAALDAHLEALAAQQGTVWLVDDQDSPNSTQAAVPAEATVERGQVLSYI
jgi:hypothetical protein